MSVSVSDSIELLRKTDTTTFKILFHFCIVSQLDLKKNLIRLARKQFVFFAL